MAVPIVRSKSPDMDKNQKYDRQIRLWGDHGQSCLESSQICLINASATGTEILKSIVLPGVGGFTIIDGHKITSEDVGNNFFLGYDDIGKSRAQVATRMMMELNNDVHGDFMDETPEHLLDNNPGFLENFSVVIATNLHEPTLLKLSSILWNINIPLLVCRTYGMVGYMRLQIREHTIVESHPDNTLDDLRLDRPFEKLLKYVNSINMDVMDRKEHNHTPYLIILLKILQEWKTQHDGKAPLNYKEKNIFRDMIRQKILVKENGVAEEEENFEEALKAVNTALSPSVIPSNIRDIFNDSCCQNLTLDSKPFWILTRAIKDFVEQEGEGLLPLRGTIPDMFSDSERFIHLQNLYREEASNHIEAVSKHVEELLISVGRPPGSISESEIKLFCKNAHFLKVVRGQSINDEYDVSGSKPNRICELLSYPDSELIYYVLLRAVDRFYSNYNRYPGYFNNQVELDVIMLKSCLNKLLQEWGCTQLAKDDYVHEMCKYGASELHSIAAFIGGCAAQEVIKLLTNQYVPFNNTFIYNAINVTCTTFEL